MAADFELYVKGKKVKMNEFVSSIVHDVNIAILKNLHDLDIDKISKIEIS